jgi:hypothetical protein
MQWESYKAKSIAKSPNRPIAYSLARVDGVGPCRRVDQDDQPHAAGDRSDRATERGLDLPRVDAAHEMPVVEFCPIAAGSKSAVRQRADAGDARADGVRWVDSGCSPVDEESGGQTGVSVR